LFKMLRRTSCVALGLIVSAASAAETVCVTGASGYLGTEVTAQLLDAGHTVRGTVRSLDDTAKVEYLERLEGAEERLQLFEADLLKGKESFAPCFEGATYVFHVASPFTTSKVGDPMAQLVKPAVEGTRAVMTAAAEAGTVKRVVLTSSIAAVRSAKDSRTDKCFNEDDWNTVSSIESGDTIDHYQYSKTAAELEAWDFLKTPAGAGLELATILPSFLVGPSLAQRIDSESLANMAAVLHGQVVIDCIRGSISLSYALLSPRNLPSRTLCIAAPIDLRLLLSRLVVLPQFALVYVLVAPPSWRHSHGGRPRRGSSALGRRLQAKCQGQALHRFVAQPRDAPHGPLSCQSCAPAHDDRGSFGTR